MKLEWMKVGVLIAALGGIASAQPEVKVQVVPAAKAGDAPTIVATVIGASRVPLDKLTLATAKDRKAALHASALREYAQGDEPMAVAVVVDGQELWMGNEGYTTGDFQMKGVYTPLVHAIDDMALAGALPPGSKAELLAYGSHVTVKLPMGDARQLVGAALGAQKDYAGGNAAELTDACEQALGELHKTAAARKALVVIGDGTDVEPSKAKKALAALRKQAQADHVEIYAVVYKVEMSNEDLSIKALAPDAKVIGSIDDLGAGLRAIVDRLDDRVYVTFPGWDATRGVGLPWDGKVHDLVISIDGAALAPASVVLAPKWTAPAHP